MVHIFIYNVSIYSDNYYDRSESTPPSYTQQANYIEQV